MNVILFWTRVVLYRMEEGLRYIHTYMHLNEYVLTCMPTYMYNRLAQLEAELLSERTSHVHTHIRNT
jgi:hypothetical protein